MALLSWWVGLLLLAPTSVFEASKLQQADVSVTANEGVGTCGHWKCSKGLAPRDDYLERDGASDKDCCQATCISFRCPDGYGGGEKYVNNTGNTKEECCDIHCAIYPCPENFTHRDVPGGSTFSQEDCCEPACIQHSCHDGWTPDPEKTNRPGNTSEQCCLPTCAAYTCDRKHVDGVIVHLVGHIQREAVMAEAQPKHGVADFCCELSCLAFQDKCPHHYGMDLEDVEKMNSPANSTTYVETCCIAKCSGLTCDDGWVLDDGSKTLFVKSALSGCCVPTCKNHTCSEGWVADPGMVNAMSVSLADEDCCQQTCELHNCSRPRWFRSKLAHKLGAVANADSACCDASCVGYSCPNGTRERPTAALRLAYFDDAQVCCEPELCHELRTEGTEAKGDLHCNDAGDKAACDGHYDMPVLYNNNTAVVPCKWSEALNLCRTDDSLMLLTCDPMNLSSINLSSDHPM